MKLIVGLGNPGKQYENTRHSTGFFFVGRLKKGEWDVDKIVKFFKNTSFMNDSGIEVKKTISYYKIPLEDVLVIHDDFDLELGQFKLQFGRSSAGHKGVQSVIDELGSQSFWRLRIGIGEPEDVDADDYVLSRFPSQEQEVLASIFPQILTAVQDWVFCQTKTDVREQKSGSTSED